MGETRVPLVRSPHLRLIGMSRTPLFNPVVIATDWPPSGLTPNERSGSYHLNDRSSPARCADRDIASHEKDRKIRSGVTQLQHSANIPPALLSRYRGKEYRSQQK